MLPVPILLKARSPVGGYIVPDEKQRLFANALNVDEGVAFVLRDISTDRLSMWTSNS